jgi:uncharacterized protein (DUF2336 family)
MLNTAFRLHHLKGFHPMARQLTMLDIRKLTEEPSAQIRGVLAGKIAADFRTQQYSASEAAIAADIFRILLRDADTKIRAALANELAHSDNAPHDVMLALARDDAEISLPVLEFSVVLSEHDLAAITRSTQEVIKLCAIARRESISQDLSQALMETGNGMVLHTLFKNTGAVLNETNLLPLWKRIPLTSSLLEALVERGGLPLTIVEKLYHAASDELKHRLSQRYRLHTPAISKAADDAREWELLGISPLANSSDRDEYELVEDLIDDLALHGRLTHSLIMRALCVGNIAIFECGIARLAEVPRINARILMLESSGRGLQALYQAAGMPEGFFEAVRTLLRLSLEETECGRLKRRDFRKRVVDRIYMGHYHRTVENMEYLLSIIGGKLAHTGAVH